MRSWMVTAPITRVLEQGCWRIGATERSIIAHVTHVTFATCLTALSEVVPVFWTGC